MNWLRRIFGRNYLTSVIAHIVGTAFCIAYQTLFLAGVVLIGLVLYHPDPTPSNGDIITLLETALLVVLMAKGVLMLFGCSVFSYSPWTRWFVDWVLEMIGRKDLCSWRDYYVVACDGSGKNTTLYDATVCGTRDDLTRACAEIDDFKVVSIFIGEGLVQSSVFRGVPHIPVLEVDENGDHTFREHDIDASVLTTMHHKEHLDQFRDAEENEK